MTDTVEAKFWARVVQQPNGKCWLWSGVHNTNGYPMLSTRRASHVALELSGRPRHDNLCALHSCDNPGCVNPGHLRWGSNQENIMDMVKRKRHHANRRTHCIHGHELSGLNLQTRPNGQRTCRQCGINRSSARRAKVRSAA